MPTRPLQAVCGPGCAIKHAEVLRDKKRRSETRRMREKIKTKAQRMQPALNAVKRYVRARDRYRFLSAGKMPECISCGINNPNIQYAAGHFKTAGGHPELALDPVNMRLQCNRRCNKALSGNINGTKDTRGYIAGILEWYGQEKGQEILEYLDGHHEIKNYTQDDLNEIRKKYNKLALELEKKLQAYN